MKIKLFIFALIVLTFDLSYAFQEASPTREQSLLKVLSNPVEAGQARIDLIQGAKKSITAQYFIYADDAASFVGLALLREAARRGVKVRLIIDSMYNGIPVELRELLQVEGIEIREYHPINILHLRWITHRMHDKVLIIDEEEMITGGRNIENDYYEIPGGHKFKDRDIYVKGSGVVSQATTYFNQMWEDKKNVKPTSFGVYTKKRMDDECLLGGFDNRRLCTMQRDHLRTKYVSAVKTLNNALKFLGGEGVLQHEFQLQSDRSWASNAVLVSKARFLSDPVLNKGPGIDDSIISLINAAQVSFIAETPYLAPDVEMLDALAAAVKRGVDVRILTNSSYSGDSRAVLISYYKSEQKEMLQRGIKLWEYKGPETIHSKSFVVDDTLTFIGSFNFDRMSFNLNREVGIVTDDKEISAVTRESIEERMQGAWEIGEDGRPLETLQPEQSYPWKQGTNGVITKIMRLLLPLYKHII